jgi:hypothetical protein
MTSLLAFLKLYKNMSVCGIIFIVAFLGTIYQSAIVLLLELCVSLSVCLCWNYI